MAKGYLCPICKTHTVQPLSTNRMKCSKCGTVFDKSRITSG
jgi:ribosomal protein L37AE/L43A